MYVICTGAFVRLACSLVQQAKKSVYSHVGLTGPHVRMNEYAPRADVAVDETALVKSSKRVTDHDQARNELSFG